MVFVPCGTIEVVCQSTTLAILEKVYLYLLFQYKVGSALLIVLVRFLSLGLVLEPGLVLHDGMSISEQ